MTDNGDKAENKRPRRGEPGYRNAEERRAEAELAANPPQIRWETVRGIWVARMVRDPDLTKKPGPVPKKRGPRPDCKCDIYGSPKRRAGDHHDEGCGRRKPW